MIVRALLFCAALMAAAITIALPATTDKRDQAAQTFAYCVPGAIRKFQLSLPMTPTEARILARQPVWLPGPMPEEYRPALKRYVDEQCLPPPPNLRGSRAGLALGALGAGGLVLYWLSPYQQIFFRRLTRLHPTPRHGRPRGHRPDLADAVYQHAGEAGVSVHGVWLNASDYTGNAVAFGHVRQRHIELASGMEKLFDEDPGTFEVVIRHELGHIRHRDLDVTHGVTALWGAFTVLLAATFCFAVSEYAGQGEYLLRLSFHLALLAYVLYAARNTFLQSRELHADAFAVSGSTESGTGEDRRRKLDEFFARLAAQRTPTVRGARFVITGTTPAAAARRELGLATWPFATHPALQRRRAALRHPALAGELNAWEVALTGCIAMFAINLLLGNSYDVMMIAFDVGFLDDVVDLSPVYPWLAIPLLLPAGAVLGLGIRHTVAAWGGARNGPALTRRLALLTGGLWSGLCVGCMVHPTQEFGPDRSEQLSLMWWHRFTDGVGLGLALTAILSVLALALFALVCDTVCRPRVASSMVGAYGALTALAWFPTALPDGTAPYLHTAVVGVAVLSGAVLPFLLRRLGRPVPVVPFPEGPVTRVEAPDTTKPRLLLAHAITAAVAAWAVGIAAKYLVDTPDSPLTLVASLGLICHVAALAAAAAAPHDAEFRRRARCAAVSLAVGGGAAAVQSASVPIVLILLGPVAGVMVAGRTSAVSLYALRHRRSLPRPRRASRAGRRCDEDA
ncbi:M48 family metalloprotease [Streptomyces sp. NRRL F-2580]|uniref:M48 family metalloprotease n=1 Tax=Streptomyces sp. NRRL F-2580 TaxID=1463841 RepID=UPI0004C94EB3|nr:M48 family metalloprotease [Streptomyces sp. NRRL F-2580]